MAVLAHKRLGNGPPLLILHGLFGANANWRSIAGKLAERFTTYSLDLRNHGGSFWHEEMDYRLMAEDVKLFLHQQQLDRCVVLGHSMGGKTAMVTALTYPGLVEKLIVADIAPVTYPHDHLKIVEALQSLPIAEFTNRSQADKALSAWISEPGLRGFLLQNLVREDGQYAWRINLNAIANSMHALTSFPEFHSNEAYTKSALFVHGKNSEYITESHKSDIERLFTNAQIVGVENAGHWLHAEQPEAFFKVINDFLR